ncbi:Zinc/iron permease [Lasallia pustulata]|uniref:Zinc/iron permease n=1 Tax=Lasallia pustulata TaxID=136370 RepID=A0A1W5D8C8_9LECA|nr:Zinc/iron permease [Lasallia pustulata]
MPLGNDTRGWVMTCISGIACVIGSSIICVDLIIQCIPGKRNFRIQDSNAFLSSSLSLSFGVMLFSSLYSMLPSSKKNLMLGGFSPRAAAYTLIGCFLAGVVGIQILSRLLHHYIPSHVVDCDHTHSEQEVDDEEPDARHSHSKGHSHKHHSHQSEDTPLLSRDGFDIKPNKGQGSQYANMETTQRPDAPYLPVPDPRRPSLQTRLTSKVSTFVSGAKPSCDEGGPCYGYSEPCGQECFKAITRNPTRAFTRVLSSGAVRNPTLRRSATAPYTQATQAPPEGLHEESDSDSSNSMIRGESNNSHKAVSRGRSDHQSSLPFPNGSRRKSTADEDPEGGGQKRGLSSSAEPTDPSQAHHHHVPTNAFLSIGLQTSIAIALHKLPEGFITYATNHANPTLGFAVFMALFIHNITEGFAMALPLYLALGSRWKAMFWSSLLGGISQPLGAGIAALWFHVAGRGDMAPGAKVYGCMFAVTAGVMTSVALQLFSESLSLTHNRNLCIAFAFIGMGILGVSFALTAG